MTIISAEKRGEFAKISVRSDDKSHTAHSIKSTQLVENNWSNGIFSVYRPIAPLYLRAILLPSLVIQLTLREIFVGNYHMIQVPAKETRQEERRRIRSYITLPGFIVWGACTGVVRFQSRQCVPLSLFVDIFSSRWKLQDQSGFFSSIFPFESPAVMYVNNIPQ